MATVYLDDTRKYYYHPYDGDWEENCKRCNSKPDEPHHRCSECGELFDWNQCFNARDLCTECCGED